MAAMSAALEPVDIFISTQSVSMPFKASSKSFFVETDSPQQPTLPSSDLSASIPRELGQSSFISKAVCPLFRASSASLLNSFGVEAYICWSIFHRLPLLPSTVVPRT